MKRGGNGVGPVPTDLLVCFPSRAHLSLLPKPLCSPSRLPSSSSKPHHHPSSSSRPSPRSHSSPLFRPDPSLAPKDEEPTSPKVTCAGQIRVRPKTRSKPDPKSPSSSWLDSLGLKKDLLHFLGALRGLRFHLRCFGSLPSTSDFEDDDDDESQEEDEEEEEVGSGGNHPSTIFSKWFMVLEEKEQSEDGLRNGLIEEAMEEQGDGESGIGSNSSVPLPSTPPSNALLLLRCRSAPAKGGGVGVGVGVGVGGGGEGEVKERGREGKEKEERLLLMSYAPDFFKVSTEIAKETWVVGSVDPLARSRSWKR